MPCRQAHGYIVKGVVTMSNDIPDDSDPNDVSVERRKRLEPCGLTPDERRVFEELIKRDDASHLAERDKWSIAVFCSAMHLSRLYAEQQGNEIRQRMGIQTTGLVELLANRLLLGRRGSE